MVFIIQTLCSFEILIFKALVVFKLMYDDTNFKDDEIDTQEIRGVETLGISFRQFK